MYLTRVHGRSAPGAFAEPAEPSRRAGALAHGPALQTEDAKAVSREERLKTTPFRSGFVAQIPLARESWKCHSPVTK